MKVNRNKVDQEKEDPHICNAENTGILCLTVQGCRLHHKICHYIFMVYFLVMAVIYPFYAPGGYTRIGEVKYVFFSNVSLITLAAAGTVVLLAALVSRDREWIVKHYRRMSVTDWFAYGYGLAVMVSYLCCDYKETALWGAEGWYMGVMSQLMFVLLYFCFSRYFCRPSIRREATGALSGKCLGLWLAAAAGVFLLGICNRYSFYPIIMEGQTETFISTLGNINWFCGYWSVTAPLGILLYWCSEKRGVRILTGIYSLAAMLSGITQGSNSAYLVFIVLFIALFILSLQGNQKLYRFLELCMIFMAACQTGKLLQCVPGLSYNYWGSQADAGAGITAGLLTGNAATGAFLILLGGYMLLHVLDKHGMFRIERYRGKCFVGMAAAVGLLFTVICLRLIDGRVIYFREVPGTVGQSGYRGLALDEDWGNGRGAAWTCGADAFRSMDLLHKTVGVGPDCFADYIYDVQELAQRMADSFGSARLTNAHNEWLTVLVNTGVLGLLCYVGIMLTAFVRYLRKAEEQPLLYVFAVTLLAYTAHNMVSFQQVLSTPYLFIVLGAGEGLRRLCRREDGEGSVA